MNNKEFIKSINKINNILKSNNLALINEFENEFIKLENKKETSSIIIFSNRELIRKSFICLVLLYGEKANIKNLYTLINNTYDEGKEMISTLFKTRTDNDDMKLLINNVCLYFKYDYYASTKTKKSDTYKYCLPTRYLIDKIILTININEGNLVEPNNKENIEEESPIDFISYFQLPQTNKEKSNTNNDFNIPMEDLEDDLM